MYAVSDAYKTAMKQPVQRFRMTGKVGRVSFTDDNILSGSFSITNQCSDDSSVQIGQVYIGELDVTLMNMSIARYSWKDQEIAPVFGMRLENGNFEDVPLGIFTIDSAKHTASGVVIKAYDHMAKLDKNCSVTSINGTAYNLMLTACTACGLTLGTTSEEFAAMANGSDELSLYSETDIETWRDFVSWVAASIAANVYAGRDGKIYVRAYDQTVVDEIDTEHRFTGCEFSDFSTRYTGLSVVNIDAKTTSYYALDVDDGLTYNIGSDPFLQYGVDEKKDAQRKAILTALSQVDYVPFKAELIGNPAYDLMDVFRFTDGLADKDKLFCMTKFTFNYNQSFTMQGVGQDPALASAKSKTDKNLQGILSSNENQDYIRYYDYQNAADYDIADAAKAKIIDVRYITVKNTHIDFHAEIKLTLDTTETETDELLSDTDVVMTVTYYLNGEEVKDYVPVETMPDGTHLLHLLFTWNSTANLTGNFEVWLSMVGGSCHIARGDARAYMAGQGLAGSGAWDGTITVYDTVPEMNLFPVYRSFDASVIFDLLSPETAGISDIVPSMSLTNVLQPIAGTIGAVKFLHRFNTLRPSDLSYDSEKIEIKDGEWRLKDGVTIAEMTTKDLTVESILQVTSVCDSNNVNFLVSFDHGVNWLEYANGWITPDTSKASYGMFGPAMAVIDSDKWNEMLKGTIQMKVIIHEKGHITDLQIYTKEVEE
ncbi:MAG: hypothetical protein LKF15_03035 [Lachnospiraceae bacterium]|jgi:hypothetical protein|nr:hypothetical protein [Lachnospiraceae bacterium]MCH4027929.1 hypothetical protein [Lachnospiraceae bacterium]MCH4065773.1 hypothetical protein [Lachnospiraceae bacterium]MCH4111809.1 hypothetical protein [Lachnospiraceae bacterium]